MILQEGGMVLQGRRGPGKGKGQVKYTLAANGLATPIKTESKEAKEVKAVLGTVAIFVAAGTTAGVLGWFFYTLDTPRNIMLLDGLHIQFTNSRYVEFLNKDMKVLLRGNIGSTFDSHFVNYDFQPREDHFVMLVLVDHAQISIKMELLTNGIKAYHINWTAKSCIHSALEDCFHLRNDYWYGMGAIRNQLWPADRWTLPEVPLTPGIHTNGSLGGIQERYWLVSSGAAITVDWDVPLWISVNSSKPDQMCLKAAYDPAVYPHLVSTEPLSLRYTVYLGSDMKTLHNYISRHVASRPGALPGHHLFTQPSWTVVVNDRASWGGSLSGSALALDRHGFQSSLLVLRFRGSKQSDVHPDLNVQGFQAKLQGLTQSGFCPALTIFPLAFLPSLGSHLALSGTFLGQESVYGGIARWYQTTLQSYKARGICACSVYMEARTSGLPPSISRLRLLHSLANASAGVFPDTLLVTASGLTASASFVHMKARFPWWGSDGGLRSIIPEALTLGLIGYPFIMAPGLGMYTDIAGESRRVPGSPGRASGPRDRTAELPDRASGHPDLTSSPLDNSSSPPSRAPLLPIRTSRTSVLPERALYLRWLAIIVFFPAIHFTTPPWQYDINVTQATKTFLQLHQEFLPKFFQLAKEATITGNPILRPIWWISPSDRVAQVVEDQFLVGEDTMVAPIVHQGSDTRDIYIPPGLWWDNLRHSEVIGKGWLRSYGASLYEVPYFTKVKNLS